MTTLLAESTGQLTITITDHRFDEAAFRSAAGIVDSGEAVIVVDGGGCFEPSRMTHSARTGALDPAGLMKRLHILRARSAAELENIILNQLDSTFHLFGTRH